MEEFRINLKTFLGLAMPNQYCPTVRMSILGWFWSKMFGPESPNLHNLLCIVLLYDIIVSLFFIFSFCYEMVSTTMSSYHKTPSLIHINWPVIEW